MSEKCPVCGELVKVVGGETKHYESVAQQQITELQDELQAKTEESAALQAERDALQRELSASAEKAEGLQAHVNRLREVCQFGLTGRVQDSYICMFRDDYDRIVDALEETPQQSLAEHDARVRNEAIDVCEEACEDAIGLFGSDVMITRHDAYEEALGAVKEYMGKLRKEVDDD